MPRILASPKVKKAVVEYRIDRFGLPITYVNGTVDTAESKFAYSIVALDQRGRMIESKGVQVAVDDLPQNVQAALRVLYKAVTDHADREGLMGPGTDTGDL